MPLTATRPSDHPLPRQAVLPEPVWIEGGADGASPVRMLQDRLFAAFEAEAGPAQRDGNLSLSARIALMIAASCLLWAAIGGVVYRLI